MICFVYVQWSEFNTLKNFSTHKPNLQKTFEKDGV